MSRVRCGPVPIHAPTPVHVLNLLVQVPGQSDQLDIEFQPALGLAPSGSTSDLFINKRLVLYVCDYRVVIWNPQATGEGNVNYSKFSYPYTGSDWSTYSTRDVRLTWDETPTFVSAKLDGTSLELTFSEPLDESKVPARNEHADNSSSCRKLGESVHCMSVESK